MKFAGAIRFKLQTTEAQDQSQWVCFRYASQIRLAAL